MDVDAAKIRGSGYCACPVCRLDGRYNLHGAGEQAQSLFNEMGSGKGMSLNGLAKQVFIDIYLCPDQ
eukprot:8565903-Karenia_brevis.AAC.1